MWPRIAVFISPSDTASATYRVRIRKGWWGGPGTGGKGATLADFDVQLRATDERDRIREALRAAAESFS